MIFSKTQSVCPTCGTDCPAVVVQEDKVYIDSFCLYCLYR